MDINLQMFFSGLIMLHVKFFCHQLFSQLFEGKAVSLKWYLRGTFITQPPLDVGSFPLSNNPSRLC